MDPYYAGILVSIAVALLGGFVLGRLTSARRPGSRKLSTQWPANGLQAEAGLSPVPVRKPIVQTATIPAAYPTRRKLIVVSYRLPIAAVKKEGAWHIHWDNTQAAISNMPTLSSDMDVSFVGFPDVFVAREDQDDFETQLEKFNCIPVFLDRDLHDRFFGQFCKGILWPLFHYLMPTNRQDFAINWDSLWQTYTTVNMMYSRKITTATEDDEKDYIWIHNYHLLLVPSFVRKKLSRAKIGLFLHTPFPTSDIFRTLPGKTNLLRGMLCADLLGFHTYDYVRHFLSACKRILDLDFEALPGGALGIVYCGRSVSIRISHMGIPTQPFHAILHSEKVVQLKSEILAANAGRQIIVAVDEFDVVKGVLVKLQAFERFLNAHGAEWATRIVLIVVVTPSLNSAEEQDAIRLSVVRCANQIQKRYGKEVIQIIETGANNDLETVIAHFSAANVALFTSFFDGLNVLPFEFTAAQDPDDPGVLILSEFMGCSRSLNGIIRVNPLDLEEMEEAISKALVKPKATRVAQHKLRHKFVLANSFQHWARGFLADLGEASKQSDALNYVQVGWGSGVRLIGLKADFKHLQEADIVSSYRSSKHRLLLFDYDGTLTTSIDEAPTESTLKILSALCGDPGNLVFILSGRERQRLSEWFSSLPRIGLVAEKGVYIRWPGDDDWEALPGLGDFSWKDTAIELMKSYSERTDGAYTEIKESALVWHYHNADPEYGRSQASELGKYIEKLLESTQSVDVVRYDLNRILEVKPRGVSKGLTTRKIVARLKEQGGVPQFVLCMGDDRSDEDAFVALQSPPGDKAKAKAYTVCVGIKPSNAHYYVHDTAEVLKILSSLSMVSMNASRSASRLPSLFTPH
ncbi:Trehalose-phosphatase [Plasmodiophora brassicae]